MQTGKHGHKHHGKSTRDILDPNRILEAIDLNEGESFMDAGCGDGYISLAASKIVKAQGQVYALDAYEPSLESLRNEMDELSIVNIEVIMADMTISIPVEDNKIDKCVMANVLHGFASEGTLEPVLNEIRRVLKPGGTFAVVEFIKVNGPPGPPYDVRLSPENVENILEDHGLEIGGTTEVGKYHY
ncbi:MAG: class I SAM-dependent methyltransferase, partial [Methanobacterium sp.]|nr:class I SAM-dependent methyltransferase [Methanobacterium sp.]